jgi:hypothetical protein
MREDLKKIFDSQVSSGSFIKTTDAPVSSLTSEQKVILNRKGNVFFNQGDIQSARRLFITTGYSDGLTRVADVYMKEGKEIEALKLYWLAHNKNKIEMLSKKIADLISTILI